MSNGRLKNVMVEGMTPILRSIYENLENRWGIKEQNTKFEKRHGVFDYNIETNKYEWSGLNFFNTNYTMCYNALLLLEEKGVKIEFLETDDYFKTLSKLRIFLKELEKRKNEFFFDGEIKDFLLSIHDETWSRGEKYSNIIKSKYKNIWTDSVSFTDNEGEKGILLDMIEGIDAKILTKNDEEKTIQVKGCKKVEIRNNSYFIYCVVDYSKYRNIDYFCFFPNNDNNFYVFKNNKTGIENIQINNEPVFVINDNLLHYQGLK